VGVVGHFVRSSAIMADIEAVVESTKQLELSTPENASLNHSNDSVDEPEENQELEESLRPPRTTSIHPLEYDWTFWYDKRPAQGKRMKGEQESYESNLRAIGTFGTVEDFWRYYNHLVKPSKLELNSNYHFFKTGIKPMWEDSANSKGGKWVFTFKDKSMLDSCWENVVLGLVGETLDEENEICGAVISRRKVGDRIAVWTKTKDNEGAILSIGQKLKAMLGVDPSKLLLVTRLEYQSHEDSMKSGASYSNPTRYKL